MTESTILQIAEDLASAAATLCCWIEDDCPENEDPSQAECDEAIEKARAAIVNFDRWQHVQRGQLVLLIGDQSDKPMNAKRNCKSCKFWLDDTATRQDEEVYGECQHPQIKEMLCMYADAPYLVFSEKPVPTIGKFCCALWEKETE